MKRAPLLLIALLPFMAGAAGDNKAEVDQQKLQDAVPVTEIVGQDVVANSGREVGELETVTFKQDGSIAYYEIESELTEVDAFEEADAAYDADEAEAGTAEDGAVVIGSADHEVLRVKPENISFKDGGNLVTVDMEVAELMEQQDDASLTDSENLLDATDIVGMQVDLADTESFGEVEDVMISQDGKEAVALVVDNWDGVNKERRALPATLQAANTETESIKYDFGRDALSETGNFELEQYMDDM